MRWGHQERQAVQSLIDDGTIELPKIDLAEGELEKKQLAGRIRDSFKDETIAPLYAANPLFTAHPKQNFRNAVIRQVCQTLINQFVSGKRKSCCVPFTVLP